MSAPLTVPPESERDLPLRPLRQADPFSPVRRRLHPVAALLLRPHQGAHAGAASGGAGLEL